MLLSLALIPGCGHTPAPRPNEPVQCGRPKAPQLLEIKGDTSSSEAVVKSVANMAYDLNELKGYSEKLEEAVDCYEASNKK